MPSLFDLPRVANRAALFASLFLAIAAGCDSCCAEDPVVGQPDECVLTVDCKDGGDFRYGSCVQGGCSVDADCCPGNRCRPELNVCFPRLLDADFACETNADCEDPAQVCATIKIGDRDPLPTCVYESCGGDSDCGFGRACFQNKCIASAPCDGGCPAGSVCELNSNSCHELPTGEAAKGAVDASCTKACDGILVLENEDIMVGDVCCELACTCQIQPPVIPTRIGRYARVVVTGQSVLVSAYDAQFGDLVVVRYGLNGVETGKEYVDGVPAVPPVADPQGARGGIVAPGPNVGKHTSIVADANGLGRVAYHDVDGNALKVAIEGPAGQWRSHVVDGAQNPAIGQVGTFTDMAILSNGTILVSYLAHNTTIGGVTGTGTGVKLARSRTPAPQSATDWEIFVVDGAPFVVDPAARIEPRELPRGLGLHTNIEMDGDVAIIGYYDNINGDLKLARFSGSSAEIFVVDGDGQGGRLPGDTGRYPALGIVGNDLLVAYEDPTRHALRLWRGPKETPGQGGGYDIADQLREPDRSGAHFVGAGARMTTTGSRPVMVHQDASTLDLRFATLEGSSFATTSVLSDGAHGFYADVAAAGQNAFLVSVVAELDDRGRERSRLLMTVKTLP